MSQNESAARTRHVGRARLKSQAARAALTALATAGVIAGSAGMASAATSSSAASPCISGTQRTVAPSGTGTEWEMCSNGAWVFMGSGPPGTVVVQVGQYVQFVQSVFPGTVQPSPSYSSSSTGAAAGKSSPAGTPPPSPPAGAPTGPTGEGVPGSGPDAPGAY
jgi:hypothetical protein